jgi:hypothetical protein
MKYPYRMKDLQKRSIQQAILGLLSLIAVAFPQNLLAEGMFEASTNIDIGTSSNAFYLDTLGATAFSDFDLNLNFYPSKSNFYFFGNLFYSNYLNATERNYGNLTAGTNYYLLTSKDSTHNLNLSGYINSRIGTEEYSAFDYLQYSLNFEFVHSVSDYFNYSFSNYSRSKNYQNLTEINFLENILSFNNYINLETRTTIYSYSDFAIKKFTVDPTPQDSAARINPIDISSKTSNFIQKKQRRIGKIEDVSSTNSNLTQTSMIETTPSKFDLGIKISQNITDNIGISIGADYTKTLFTLDSTFVEEAIYYSGESELFEDPYSNDNFGLNASFTYILPYSIVFRTEGNYYSKKFKYYVQASDSSFTLRKDTQLFFDFNLSKSYEFENKLVKYMMFGLYLSNYDNKSNSYLFDYKDTSYGINFEINF